MLGRCPHYSCLLCHHSLDYIHTDSLRSFADILREQIDLQRPSCQSHQPRRRLHSYYENYLALHFCVLGLAHLPLVHHRPAHHPVNHCLLQLSHKLALLQRQIEHLLLCTHRALPLGQPGALPSKAFGVDRVQWRPTAVLPRAPPSHRSRDLRQGRPSEPAASEH